MGNIIAGSLTGIFIYTTDMVLKQFVITGGFMEIIKFVLQGTLTYIFVEYLQRFAGSRGDAIAQYH